MSADLAARICTAGRELYRQGLNAGVAGNLSARLEGGRILITRAGTHKGKLVPSDLVVVGAGDEDPAEDASSELPLHRACYAADALAGAVIHAHAPALTAAGLRDLPVLEQLPELELATGAWATVELLPSGSRELGRAVGAAVQEGAGVLLLRNHGAVTVGPGVEAASQRIELAELAAYAVLLAEDAEGPGVMARVGRLIETLSTG